MKKIRLVIADNHRIVRSALVSCLAQNPDIDIIGDVSNPASLIETIGQIQPDVLLLDVNVPDPELIKTISRFKNQCPNMRILILSAFDTYEYIAPLLQIGAHGFVLKSDSFDTLLRGLNAVADGEKWLSSAVIDVLVSVAKPVTADPRKRLTRRENEVLQLIAAGCNNIEIADTLVIARQTVKNHVRNIFTKLGVTSRVEAALYAVNHERVLEEATEEALNK